MDLTRERLRVFAHVHAEKAALYRAVMAVFTAAKASFAIHLRPADVAAALVGSDLAAVRSPEAQNAQNAQDDLEAALRQLCEWGNLESHPDTTDVATVEDFYRSRYLYQLTVAGEAAERALAFFAEVLAQPGELQTAALSDIHALLEELAQFALVPPSELDDGKVHRTLRALSTRFEELTSRAQAFISSLQRTIDLHELELERFLAYKETLIEYIERFIGELVIMSSAIAATLERLADQGPDRWLEIAARRDLVDALEATAHDHAVALSGWQRRWQGLRAWFLGGPHSASQAEVLRARARSAIPSLLATVAAINDRRLNRSDRSADLRTLARWFAASDSELAAHRLWRTAFALAPSRHLQGDDVTLATDETVPATTSWLEAPPLRLSPRLRRTGRYTRVGRATSIIDRSQEKAFLRQLVAAESAELERARQRLISRQRVRLSELGELGTSEFELFLDLLGETLAVWPWTSRSARTSPRAARAGEAGLRVAATSSDGSLRVVLEPTGDGRVALIATPAGCLSGADHFLTVLSANPVLSASAVPSANAGLSENAVEVGS